MIWYPQSTYNTCPVIAAPPSLARNAPVAPNSSGSTLRLSGACSALCLSMLVKPAMPRAANVLTGQVLYVDCGYQIMGM